MTTGSGDPSYTLQLVSVNNIQHYNYTPQKSNMEPENNGFKMNLLLLPLDPKTMKNEGFKPPIYGLVITPKNEGFEFPW